jgi:hypothetical protein
MEDLLVGDARDEAAREHEHDYYQLPRQVSHPAVHCTLLRR